MKFKDIYYYAQGTIRYKLFYSIFAGLIRDHILQQIFFRVNSMDMKCYEDGQCKLCGCKTTALQMCDKACDKPCYPPMMNKKDWHTANTLKFHVDMERDHVWLVDAEKFKLMKDEME